ncbi:hypothetical protein QQ008_21290 [Fulvivirgaceae bacterium BMA10]|uniref:Uncharacterized protein n=1 Tax=Splendidivirga corallicola TaxID=3051826 RepID=A0ABT8KT65_9BACT|nr:hypothetical protein [Fulvivirgaceae bacterium BMA10]
MASEFELKQFSRENLAKALATESIVSISEVKKREHFRYLLGYLSDLSAQMIVIEPEYISKSYLSDYSNYYSTCFQDYGRICKRVHFLMKHVDKESFLKELLDKDSTFFDDNYLGYTVVKPLPDSVIGTTLLVTYNKKKDHMVRHYPVCRPYDINMLGKKVRLMSLAFQEQDTVVAACASVAIWSAFHRTSYSFETNLPSPSEITKSAGNLYFNYGRTFPNPGLDISQICKAIEAVGLVSELVISDEFKGDVTLARRIVYAYIRAGIPVMLFLTFRNNSEEDDQAEEPGHLITINGYAEHEDGKQNTPIEEITMIADRIEKFYAHDDQTGPFAKLKFSGETAIITPWGKPADIYAVIMPVYPKIRIKYQDIYDHISRIDWIFYENRFFEYELKWDVYLIESNQYKQEILASSYDDEIKKKSVLKHYPRYIWVARSIVGGDHVFDLIYDSTDIATGYFCHYLNLLDSHAKAYLRDGFFKEYKNKLIPIFGEKSMQNILEELK